MFFFKKEDRPGLAPPLAARVSGGFRRPWSSNPLGNSRGFRSWRVPGPILRLSWLILAFKMPPRPSKMPPRRPQDLPRRPQEPPRRPRHPLQEAQKLCFSHCFPRFSLSRAILAQRGLQDDFKSLQDPSKSFLDGPTSLHDAPKSLQDAPKTFQDGSKTSPESAQNQKNRNV